MRLHFLNVKNGDCSIIEHESGNLTMIDVSNAFEDLKKNEFSLTTESKVLGNFQQKKSPENPIDYLSKLNKKSIFRFVLTHPDMDHMDGLDVLSRKFSIANFWDTNHNKKIDNFNGSPYKKEDWIAYQDLRKSSENPKSLQIKPMQRGAFYNKNGDGSFGDGLFVLAPSDEIIKNVNQNQGDYNDVSYVIMWKNKGKKIIFGGDSHNASWKYILENFKNEVSNVDILLAPHHGRSSNRDYSFLDILKPKISLLGNAHSEHLEYYHYQKHGKHYTNNQCGNIVVSFENNKCYVLAENYNFAAQAHSFDKLYEKIIAQRPYYYIAEV